jgi:hypothetical protein
LDSETNEKNYISISSKKIKGNGIYTNKLCVSGHKMPFPEAELDEKQKDMILFKKL